MAGAAIAACPRVPTAIAGSHSPEFLLNLLTLLPLARLRQDARRRQKTSLHCEACSSSCCRRKCRNIQVADIEKRLPAIIKPLQSWLSLVLSLWIILGMISRCSNEEWSSTLRCSRSSDFLVDVWWFGRSRVSVCRYVWSSIVQYVDGVSTRTNE